MFTDGGESVLGQVFNLSEQNKTLSCTCSAISRMVLSRVATSALLAALLASKAFCQEHRIEMIPAAPEATGLSSDFDAMFSDEGLKVLRGASRVVCEFWPCKEWETKPDFEQTSERLYPFQPGQLIGLMHYKRRGKDFRDQTIKSGWYTLRYALQPTDGNHEGTSPTRDFLLMVRAEDDKSPASFNIKELFAASAEAAGSAHPAMLCLQRPPDDTPSEPSIRHVDDNDWWILHVTGKGASGGEAKDVSVDLIVVGHADE